MWSSEVVQMIIKGIGESLYMTLAATLFGYVLRLPWGVVLAVTDADGIKPNRPVYRVLDFITNIMRSIPFLILLILIIPLTRLIVGNQTDRGKELWIYGDDRSACSIGGTFYCAHGRILPQGGG